jgi:hypothetical protein
MALSESKRTAGVEPRLLSLEDAATVLGKVSTRYLRLLGARGQIRLTRLGKRVLVPVSEIERLVAEGTR